MRTALGTSLALFLLATGLAVPAAASAPPPVRETVADARAGAAAGYDIKRFRVSADDDPRLARSWRAWRGREHQRYTTVVQLRCFCPPQRAVETVVRKRAVTSVTFEGRERQLRRSGYEMEALYRLLRRAYAKADEVDVTYRRGVPVEIHIDWDERLADEEQTLRVAVVRADEPEPFAYPIRPFRITERDPDLLRRKWSRWLETGIRNYVSTARQAGTLPVRTVAVGPVVRRVETVVPDGDPTAGPGVRRGYEVERLYRMLRTLYRTADILEVRYDGRGVPRRIFADPAAEVSGDEISLRVRVRERSFFFRGSDR